MERVLKATEHPTIHREAVVVAVREAARSLGHVRHSGEGLTAEQAAIVQPWSDTPNTAEELADEIIADWSEGPPALYPFWARVAKEVRTAVTRKKLVAAIAAAGARGRGHGQGARASEAALLDLLKALGLGVSSTSALRMARKRARTK